VSDDAVLTDSASPAADLNSNADRYGWLRVLVVSNMYPTEEEPWYGSFVRDQVEDLRGLGIQLRLLHFDARRHVFNYLRVARDVRRMASREHFDVIHAHYGLTGAAVSFQRRAPVLTTFHGGDYTGATPWQRYVSWFVSRLSTPVVVSEEGRRALGRPSAVVIPAGVDTNLFRPFDRVHARRELGWEAEARYVLLPGARANPTKRADLFDAVVDEVRKTVPDVQGVSLENFSRQKTVLALNAVDATLVTSYREGSPVTVRESLACMTPVVSVPVGDAARVLAGLRGCGVFPRDRVSLAGGVLDAFAAERHPELRRRAEQTSRQRVAEQVAALYAAVAARRHS